MNYITVDHSICTIVLDNKPQNYLNAPAFIDANELSAVIQDHACKAIIVTGAGRHFSAGADLNTLYKQGQEGIIDAEIAKGKSLLQSLKSFSIPIIACIEGVCFGGGLEIALNADIRIASQKALFAFPEANAALMPGLGGTIELTKIVGKSAALEIVLSGDIVDAPQAKTLGIVDHIIAPKQTTEYARELINKLVGDKDMEVVRAIVKSIRNATELPYLEALTEETKLFASLVARAVSNK